MNSINNPLDLLELKPLKYLDEHLEALWMQVASGECQYDRDWDAIDARGLSAFKDVIISFQDSGSRHDCYQYLLSTLFSAYNKFDSLERPLDGHHKEINWCEEAKRLIIRYLARVVKYTLYDGPDNCAFHMAKEVQQIPHTRGREQFLLDIGDALGIRDTICKYKVDQCYKCDIIPCEGRYIDGLCGLPEQAFGVSIIKPVYRNRHNNAIPIDLSEDDAIEQLEPNTQASHDGKDNGTKKKSTKDKLQCVEFYGLLDELEKRGYCKSEGHRYKWLRTIDLYSYLCFKVTVVFVDKLSQIEIKYISNNLIWCAGDVNTQGRYARKYRRKNPNRPENADVIDALINEAKAGHFSKAG